MFCIPDYRYRVGRSSDIVGSGGQVAGVDWVKEFWAENDRCFAPFSTDKPRVPVSLHLGEDWIKWRMGIKNHRRFHLDFDYQQEVRLACGEISERELGIPIGPGINLGSVLYSSLFGGKVIWPEDTGPWIEPVIEDPVQDVPVLIRHMERKDILDCGVTPQWLEWRDRIAEEYDVEIKGGGGFHGLATLGSLLCGTVNFIYWLYDYPRQMHALMDLIVDVAIEYMRRMRKRTGAPMRGLSIANDNVAFLNPELYSEFCLERERHLYDIFSEPGVDRRYFHSDSDNTHMLELLNELELDGVNLGPEVNPVIIRQKMPNTVIYGQLPPFLVRDGTSEEIMAAARRDIERVGDDGGLVLSTAGSINDGTPEENIRAIMRAAELYGRYEDGKLAILS